MDESSEMFQHAGEAEIGLPSAGTAFVRAGGEWVDSGTAGFRIRPLMDDDNGRLRTSLMTVDPGATADLHAHAAIEQIYVIEGSFADQEATYGPGDFIVRAPGAMHTASSDTGAVVLLTYVMP